MRVNFSQLDGFTNESYVLIRMVHDLTITFDEIGVCDLHSSSFLRSEYIISESDNTKSEVVAGGARVFA